MLEWYALYVQTHHERHVEQRLSQKGVVCFLPLMGTWSKRLDRRKRIQVPMFKGYLFVNVVLDAYSHQNVIRTPAVLCFVRNSEGPLPVPHHQIESLQAIINTAMPLTVYSYLKEGDWVRVVRGPLACCVGILQRLDHRRGRLIVSLPILGKSVSTELDIEDCESMGS